MTFEEIITEARQIEALSTVSAEYVRRWNALEDRLLDLSEAEAFEIYTQAEVAGATDIAAHVILTMLESDRG